MDELAQESQLLVLKVVLAAVVASDPEMGRLVAQKCAELLPNAIRGRGAGIDGPELMATANYQMQEFWGLARPVVN